MFERTRVDATDDYGSAFAMCTDVSMLRPKFAQHAAPEGLSAPRIVIEDHLGLSDPVGSHQATPPEQQGYVLAALPQNLSALGALSSLRSGVGRFHAISKGTAAPGRTPTRPPSRAELLCRGRQIYPTAEGPEGTWIPAEAVQVGPALPASLFLQPPWTWLRAQPRAACCKPG